MKSLEVLAISKYIGSKNILNNVSLWADAGQTVVLLGPNGAGKTTLLKSVMGLSGLVTADKKNKKNCVFLEGKLINQWPVSRRVAHGLVYLPQQTSLFQHMSVEDNLRIVYEYQECWHNRIDKEFIEQRDYWLATIGVSKVLSQLAKTLSGGQKRKVEVVRSLLMFPKIIMFDEPFAGVDPKSIYELKGIFQRMADKGMCVIISDHHVDQLLSIATRAYLIVEGKNIISGSIRDILECPYARDYYLGKSFSEEISDRFLDKHTDVV